MSNIIVTRVLLEKTTALKWQCAPRLFRDFFASARKDIMATGKNAKLCAQVMSAGILTFQMTGVLKLKT